MKKILAIVLALAMVLGLGSVAFAAEAKNVKDKPAYTIVTEGAPFASDPAKADFLVHIDWTAGSMYVDAAKKDTVPLTLTAFSATVIDNEGQTYAATTLGSDLSTLKVDASRATKVPDKIYVQYSAVFSATLHEQTSAAVTEDVKDDNGNQVYVLKTDAGKLAYWQESGSSGAGYYDAKTGGNAVAELGVVGKDQTDGLTAANYVKLTKTTEAAFADVTYDYTITDVLVLENEVDNDGLVDPAIAYGLLTAVKNKSTTAYINVDDLSTVAIDPDDYKLANGSYDLTALDAAIGADKDQLIEGYDWGYITNTWRKADWYSNFNYLGMSFQFFSEKTGTTFFIDAADLDYTWSKVVDLEETTGLVKYSKTEAEMYNVIRAITGDTKNPYVFGFAQYDNIKDRGTSVPKMTITKVIPQQWINYYGHKSLYLFAWDAGISCDNWAHNDPKVLAETTLDATTLTQRISFSTSDLYKTLVLAAKAPAADTEKPADDKTDDANPNTGANDIVNVAIVFAVISLAAAGAFVFKKAK